MGIVAEQIRRKLTTALEPVRLEIEDESHRHAGHAGHSEAGESHFRIEIVSTGFAGKSRVQRQRLVYDILREEMATRVHALSLATCTPEETMG